MSFDRNSIFISYAWGGTSEEVADELDQIISEKGYPFIRDKRDLGFKGLIKDFMQKIGKGNSVLLIISDKYLKSSNCMFELLEVRKHGNFFSRVFPIVLSDADIYKPIGIISYLKYWEDQIQELNAAIKGLDSYADTQGIREDIDLYTDIRGAIAELASTFRDMNTLSLDEMRAKNYSPVLDLLDGTKKDHGITPEKKKNDKKGKILYHIPGMMQIEHWTRCIVRLAWDDILLKEGLNIPENSEVVEEIRLGKVMQVSLGDGRDGTNFDIKSLSTTEQLIFDDDFTEWLFDVKAHKEGTFTLILKVTLHQIIEGFGERKKDIVLEREVKTEAFVPEALPEFEVAQDRLTEGKSFVESGKAKDIFSQNISKKDDNQTGKEPISTSIPSPSPINQNHPKKPKFSLKRMMPYAASLVVILISSVYFLADRQTFQAKKSPNSQIVESLPENIVLPSETENLILVAIEISTGQGDKPNNDLPKLFYISEAAVDSLQMDSVLITVSPDVTMLDYPLDQIQPHAASTIIDSISRVRKTWSSAIKKNASPANLPAKSNF